MSRETEKIIKAMNKYIDENSDESTSQADIDRLMQTFTQMLNSGKIDVNDGPMDSDDYLDAAYSSSSVKEFTDNIKMALKLNPDNIDAEMELINVKNENMTTTLNKLEKLIKKAEGILEKDGITVEGDKGDFWGIIETRPYMRVRYTYLHGLIHANMLRPAIAEAEYLLELCESDNLGVRYTLMMLYAVTGNVDEALKLHKKFNSREESGMLLPLAIAYFCNRDLNKSRSYLKRLKKVNADTLKFFEMWRRREIYRYMEDGAYLEGYRMGTLEDLCTNFDAFVKYMPVLGSFVDWGYEQVKR